MALKARGVDAQSFNGAQARITTNQVHGKARISAIDEAAINKVLVDGKVAVVAGFQGVDQDGNITTLGRGGSDTSAVALAAALHAQECQIYTDVDGVYTTDPRIEPNARRLAKITFEEMLEMASLGARVLQIRAVEFAGKYKVPLRVLSTFKPGRGTLITLEDQQMEQAVISGIAFNRDEAKITIMGVPDRPGVAYAILGPVADSNIEVDMIIQNTGADGLTDFTFTVHRNDFHQTMELLKPIVAELEAQELNGDDCIVKISVVGVGMRSHAGIASALFKTLSAEGINVEMISTSEIKISVVVDEKYLELAVRALHREFGLDQEPTS
jgi:aspartate kinase